MQVSSVALAEEAVELGVDGLVAQGAEAGGHARGTVGLHALLGELRARYPERLLVAAGGIADGATVAAAIRAGADGVWVGTRLADRPSPSGSWSALAARSLTDAAYMST